MRKILFRNILSLYSLQVANYIFPLITLPYISRVIGPTGYGEVGFALAFIQYFSILVDYGFNFSATQTIAHQQQDMPGRSRTFWTVMACKALLALAGTILFIFTLLCFFRSSSEQFLLIVAYPSIFGGILFPSWFFQGMERMGGIALYNVIGRAASLPFVFLLIHSPKDAWLVVLIQSATLITIGVISQWMIRQQGLIIWARPSWREIRQAFADGWHMFISTVAISFYTNSNVVILQLVAGSEAVGLFIAADRIRQAAQGAITPITQAVYPRMNTLMKQNKGNAFRFIRKLALLLAAGTFLLAIFLFLFAEPIIHILLGDRFTPASSVLRCLAFLPFVIVLSNIFGVQIMLPLGMKREVSKILISSGILNLVLIVPLGYYFQAQGAAAAVLLTEIVVTIAMGVILARRRDRLSIQ